MYKAPILERYGTFRELTKGGFADVDDEETLDPNDSCMRVEFEGIVTETCTTF